MGASSTLVTFNKLSALNRAGSVPILNAVLPFPRNLQVQTNYLWDPETLGQIGSAVFNSKIQLDNVMGSLKGIKDKVMSTANAADTASAAAAGFIGTDNSAVVNGALGAAGVAVNPKEEVLFKGVKHREFDLQFDLAPLSAADSVATLKFLSTLHEFAAPELVGGGAFFKYPDTVTVVIIGTDGVVINRGNCAIKSIDCNLTPDNIWAAHKNGNPVHILLNIGFIELNLPTKDKERTLFG